MTRSAHVCDATPWDALVDELEAWQQTGRTARLWLRDDDAVADTPAVSRLVDVVLPVAGALLLAVIPARAEESLARRLAREPGLEPAMHGVAHVNHAPPGRRAEELAPERGRDELLAALTQARHRLSSLVGPAAVRWYVPPWNRISGDVADLLPEAGFEALSAFGSARIAASRRLVEHHTQVDIIDWRGGRVGRPATWVAAELARQLARARAAGGRPVGILTHHLVHDETAWSVLTELMRLTGSHAACRWVRPTTLLAPL